jgi:Cu/Ag efflux protein CusF
MTEIKRRQSMRMIALVAASALALSAVALPKMSAAQSAMVNGQVTKIDESAGKITLKHGPIKKLDMEDGMTMVFRVQDAAMLKADEGRRQSSTPIA